MKLINITILIFMVIISVIIFILIKSTFDKKRFSKFSLNRIDKRFKKSDKLFDYEKSDRYLKKMGLKEMFSRAVTPTEFILIKIILTLIFLVGFLRQGIGYSIAFGILGYLLPDILVKVSNSVDNDEMLADIKRVYDTLRIQTKAGVFLTVSLTECYLVVKSPRLKKALLELNNYIVTKNDVDIAIEEFNSKFENPYIDTFCVVIKQSIESGKTVQILEDLSAQIKDIQEAINIKLAERIKTKLEVLQLFIYIGVTSIIVFGIFKELLSSLSTF
jgi:Flp pilus assembly protein TadB